jgi:hypothetical protein
VTDDLTRLAEDDRLLDALGRGERPDGDDQVATLLGEWRAALPETCPMPVRPPRRRIRRSLVAAALVLIAGGGVAAAAEDAEPDSPLWPVTQVLYGDLADSRAARHATDEAVRVATTEIESGHYDRATELLDRADALVAEVDEPATAEHLRNRIAAVRAQLASAAGGTTAEATEGIEEPAGKVPSPSTAVDPPPTGNGSPPTDTPEPGPDDRPDPGHSPGNPPGHGPPTGVLPTVPGLPTPGIGPGR